MLTYFCLGLSEISLENLSCKVLFVDVVSVVRQLSQKKTRKSQYIGFCGPGFRPTNIVGIFTTRIFPILRKTSDPNYLQRHVIFQSFCRLYAIVPLNYHQSLQLSVCSETVTYVTMCWPVETKRWNLIKLHCPRRNKCCYTAAFRPVTSLRHQEGRRVF